MDPAAANEQTPLIEQQLLGRYGAWNNLTLDHSTERCRNLFPVGFWSETKALIKLSLPIIGYNVLYFTFGLTSIYFCGKLGATDLAAVGLANSIFNVGGAAVLFGLSIALDTLFSQTFGSGDLPQLGVQLQRAIVITSTCCLPCASLFLVTEPILLALNQNPLISKKACQYLVYMIPSLWNQTTKPLLCGVAGFFCNIFFHYIFIIVFQLGIVGSAISQSIALLIQMILLMICVCTSRHNGVTCSGYQKGLWDDWGKWFSLGIPSLLLVSLEWWFSEIGTLLSGVIGEVELASQSILFSLDTLIYTMLPIGVGTAAGIRIGQSIGQERPDIARGTSYTTLILVGFTTITTSFSTFVLRRFIPKIFTYDERVILLTADVAQIVAINLVFDGINGASNGILRGVGLQKWGALSMLINLYVFGLPIGICLLFFTPLVLKGIWTGMIVGGMLQATTYLSIIFTLDWNREVERSKKNILDLERTNNTLNNAESNINEDLDGGSRIRGDRKNLILKRSVHILALLLIFLACLYCHAFLKLSHYFGVYCFFPNGTFSLVSLPSANISPSGTIPARNLCPGNCTFFIP